MIKQLNNQNILTTPFLARKKWELSNTTKEAVILLEQSASVADIPLAMEYIDYSSGGYPYLERGCDVALENQSEDQILYREGEKRTGIFFPEIEPQNVDGSYKRLVYAQISNLFYNNYGNPIQLFGLETLDIQSNKTEKCLTEFIREFEIPQFIFGDKISPGTINLTDNSIDDVITIVDDSNGNLYAYKNLFSRIQEIRDIKNIVLSGTASHSCPTIESGSPISPTMLSGSITASISGAYKFAPYTVNLDWTDNSDNEDGFNIYRSLTTNGSTWTMWSNIGSVGSNITTYQDIIYTSIISASYQVSAYNSVGESSYSNSASVNISSSAP